MMPNYFYLFRPNYSCVLLYSTSLSLVYGGPEWTLAIKIRNKHYLEGSCLLWAGNFPCKMIKTGVFGLFTQMYSLKADFFQQISILKVFVNDSVGFKHKTYLRKSTFQVCYETCIYYSSPPQKVTCKGEMKSTQLYAG